MPTTAGPRARTTRLPARSGTRRGRSLLVASAAALALAAAGCGDVDDQAQAPLDGTTDQAEQTPTSTEGDGEPTQAPADEETEQTEAPAGEETEAAAEAVTFVAVDIDYSQAPDQVPAGPLVVRLVNEGALPHNVTIEELDDRTVVHTPGRETGEGEVELEPGTYTYYCDVPGHRLAGMEGTLEVTEDAAG